MKNFGRTVLVVLATLLFCIVVTAIEMKMEVGNHPLGTLICGGFGTLCGVWLAQRWE
jgi:hypothetical protein